MPRYDITTPRLHVEAPLAAGASVGLERMQANYLVNVLRLGEGAAVLLFNGRDGEWLAHIAEAGRKAVTLLVERETRPQPPAGRVRLLFAPIKHARLDFLVEKATEMGAAHLAPVITRRTQVARVNTERMRANVIEAAEQCGILAPPTIAEPAPLTTALAALEPDTVTLFCDEDAPDMNPLAALAPVAAEHLALVIGPEGGFDPAERALLVARPRTVRLSLGPRILRAETAAVAALALVQAAVEQGARG